MRFEPSTVYGRPGDKVYVELHDKYGVCEITASDMVVFSSSDRTSAEVADVENKSMWPFMSKKRGSGLEITIMWDKPLFVLYRDLDTRETATLDICIVPPHDHTEMSRGGPAVGIYDLFRK
jgi:hypothetical protein